MIRVVAILSNQLARFGCYNLYKADSKWGLEHFNSVNNKMEKNAAKAQLYIETSI